MAALGYVYTLGKQTSHSLEGSLSGNATRAEFLVVQMPPRVLVYDWDQALEVRQNLVGRIRIYKNMKR